ncbi:MAG: LysM peptidoglycan-binding domain-containing protein [Chlamydiales bacterium]|nr:LysM peptidoglycan-binding domain-containing protein [Chlamydiales bacterium]NCF70075.1 LysM peptidoglycan-binding domain-containing protein [Chlamydiales bacterium]
MTNLSEDKQDLSNFENPNQKKSKRYLTLSLSLLAAGILLLMSIQFLKDQGGASSPKQVLASEQTEEVSFSQLKDLSEQQKADLDVLFRKIQAQENYISELESKLNQVPAQDNNTVVSENEVIQQALKDKNHALQVKLSQTQNELMSTKVALDTLKGNFDKEVESKKQSFSELQSLALNLEDQSKKLQEQTTYSQSLEEKLKNFMSQNSELGKKLDTETAENASMKLKVETLEQEAQENEKRVAAAENILEKVMDDFKQQAQELDTKTTELSSLHEQNQNFSNEINNIRDQLSQFQTSSDSSTQQLTQEKDEISTKLASSEQSLNLLKNELEATILKRKEDKQQTETILGSLNELQQEANKKEQELQQLQAMLAEQQSKNQELSKEVNKLSELQLAYEKEKALRQQQEQHFTALAGNLEEQRGSLQKLLESKEYLKREYEALKTSHLQLLKKVADQGSSESKAIAANTYTPNSSSFQQQSRKVHTISRGDTLTGISMEYYGTTKKWRAIYDANKDTVTDINRLKVGTNLIIP